MKAENLDVLSRTSSTASGDRVGLYAAALTVVITIVTFGMALTAIPISGANCPENCVAYPYLDTVSQYPRDFLWMLPAMGLMVAYIVLMTAIHAVAPTPRKAFSQVGLSFAIISAVILLIDYYLQFSVVPMSLMNNETAGIPLLIQYNPHGIFIALEELGYLMMSLSFLFVAPVFTRANRLAVLVRWIFITSFILTVLVLVGITITYGMERLDRFEVGIISINWLVLILNGSLLSVFFRRRLKATAQ